MKKSSSLAVLSRMEGEGEERGERGGLIEVLKEAVGAWDVQEGVGSWARSFQRSRGEVREEDDRWGLPVGERKKRKEKGEKVGCCGLLPCWATGLGPVGLLLSFFFVLFLFYFLFWFL
jgi:hypothetical protein